MLASSMNLSELVSTMVPLSFAPDTSEGSAEPCRNFPTHHVLFQLANVCFILSYLSPNGRYGTLFMHSALIVGFLLFSTWSWNVICSPAVFTWNFCFMVINMGQALHILYMMRDVRFSCKDLEEVYERLFEPMKVPRVLFKRLISPENAQIMVLHAGEAYAMQNLTRTDRLGLLLSGRANVISGHHFLHTIGPQQFLDSPEFESSKLGMEDKFKVSIIAETPCMYIAWQRTTLEYFLIKEAYMAYVLSLILARDIADKLYAMNEKIVTESGTHLDIRLPSITSSLCNSNVSLVSSDVGQQITSPSRMHLGLRIKDRNISPSQLINRNNRSKSLQTNSLGVPIQASPRISPKMAHKLSVQLDTNTNFLPVNSKIH